MLIDLAFVRTCRHTVCARSSKCLLAMPKMIPRLCASCFAEGRVSIVRASAALNDMLMKLHILLENIMEVIKGTSIFLDALQPQRISEMRSLRTIFWHFLRFALFFEFSVNIFKQTWNTSPWKPFLVSCGIALNINAVTEKRTCGQSATADKHPANQICCAL